MAISNLTNSLWFKYLTILVVQKYHLSRMVCKLKETHLIFLERIKILPSDEISFFASSLNDSNCLCL